MNKLKRVAVIGDIHAEDQALSAAIDVIASERCDRILAVGDIADGPGDLSRCCELLRTARVDAVRGNHERWALAGELRDLPHATQELSDKDRSYLDGLPMTRAYRTSRGNVLLCHGLGQSDMAHVGPDDMDAALNSNSALQALIADDDVHFVINGHTHRPGTIVFDKLTVINAGTLLRTYQPGFVIVDFESACAQFFVFGKNLTIVTHDSVPIVGKETTMDAELGP